MERLISGQDVALGSIYSHVLCPDQSWGVSALPPDATSGSLSSDAGNLGEVEARAVLFNISKQIAGERKQSCLDLRFPRVRKGAVSSEQQPLASSAGLVMARACCLRERAQAGLGAAGTERAALILAACIVISPVHACLTHTYTRMHARTYLRTCDGPA